MGGDSSLQIDVGHFLRHQIWPLVRAYRCLFLILHHTGKSAKNQKDTADVNYISLGSVEWDNVPRATLVIQETRTPGVFALIATKRYRRLGWVNHDGTVTDRRYIRQSQQPGKIFWEECTADEVRKIAAVQRQGTSGRLPGEREDLILAVIEETGSIKQEDLFQKLKTKHQIGKNRARSLAQHLEAQGDIERNVRDKIVWYEIPRSSGKEGS